MQICNLVLTHKNPYQLRRLLANLSHPACKTYLHVDKKADLKMFQAIAMNSADIILIQNRVKVHWGGPSMITAVVNSIIEIQASGHQYDFINLISGQDFPIKPINNFVDFLGRNKGKQFISYLRGQEAELWWSSGANRFQKYHFNELKIKYKYFVQELANKMLPKRKAPSGWNLVGGNCGTWWTLQAECAYYLAEKITNDKKVKDFIKLTWGIDEIIFPSLVMNSPFSASVVNNNLRYIDWAENTAHPKILEMEDLERISRSSHFFARKFDETVDSRILNLLEEQIRKPMP